MWMSITGILLNHPKTISGISVNKSLVPEYYHSKNWHRGALRSITYTDSLTGYAFGKQGIFKTEDGGKSFSEFMGGDYPESSYYRKTTDVYYNIENNTLIASAKNGFYSLQLPSKEWKKHPSLEKEYDAVKVIEVGNKLIATTRSDFFVCENLNDLKFKKTTIDREGVSDYISMVEFFFKLHDGSIWGIPGRILWDLFALTLLFLSVTAFYLWFWPKKWRRNKKRGKPNSRKQRKIFSFFYKYHLKLGIYLALFLVIIVITGMFIHPPLIVAIMKGKIKKSHVPGFISDNPWHGKIRNILYDKGQDRIVVDADGLWETDASLNSKFTRSGIPIRIFAMGATVFKSESDSTLIIGSFGGLQRYDTKTGIVKRMLSVDKTRNSRRGGLGSYMVTGYFKTPAGEEYFNTHSKGLFKINGKKDNINFQMPEKLNSEYRMSLWNYAFETHNGRIFKSLVGMFYFFINPLFGLLTILVLLSGVIDWLFRRGRG